MLTGTGRTLLKLYNSYIFHSLDNSLNTSPDVEYSKGLLTSIADSSKQAAAVAATVRHKVNNEELSAIPEAASSLISDSPAGSGTACNHSLSAATATATTTTVVGVATRTDKAGHIYVQAGGGSHTSPNANNSQPAAADEMWRTRSQSMVEDKVDGLLAVSNDEGASEMKPRSQSISTTDQIIYNHKDSHVITKPNTVTNHCMASGTSICTASSVGDTCECCNVSVIPGSVLPGSVIPGSPQTAAKSTSMSLDETVKCGNVTSIKPNPEQVVVAGSISSVSSNNTTIDPNHKIDVSNEISQQQLISQQMVEYNKETTSPRDSAHPQLKIAADLHKLLDAQRVQESHPTHGHTITSTEALHSDFKPVAIQRCTSWSPSVDALPVRRQSNDEHRRRTTDSVPSNLTDQFNEVADGHSSNTVLSAELAHIFGRKQSVPCAHHGTANDCEHCSASMGLGASHVVSNTPDHVSTCDSPASYQSYSPSMLASLNSSINTEVLTSMMPEGGQHHSIVQPHAQYGHLMSCGTCSNPHKEEETVSNIIKIARMVKQASSHGPNRLLLAELNGQVVKLIIMLALPLCTNYFLTPYFLCYPPIHVVLFSLHFCCIGCGRFRTLNDKRNHQP